MSVPVSLPAFTLGECSPSLFGRFDLARMHLACSTLRNLWVGYQGGAYSRAGTAFVGFSKQTTRSYPPRLIPFQFSINQGLALEFGNFYMRVVSNGAFVSDLEAVVVAATNANPLVLTINGTGAAAASAISVNSGISESYAPTDLVTLAGGIFSAPTVLSITNTLLLNLALNFSGVGVYAPADTIHLTGGTQSTPAVLTVQTTQVSGATVAAGGICGGPPYVGTTNAVVQGTTGTGLKFQAVCPMNQASGLLSVTSISIT